MARLNQWLERLPPNKREYTWKELLGTPEGRILEIGMIMALLSITLLCICYLRIPERAHLYLGMSGTNVVFGRAAGISFGYTFGLDHIIVITINILIETILVLIFYPLFVFSWRSLLIIRGLRGFMKSIRMAAEVRHDIIHRYGIIGLFMFVWFPFSMTGPMVGCALGYLIGLRPWQNLTIVLSSTCLAIICWALLLEEIHDRVAQYSPYASIFIIIIIIFVVIGFYILKYLRHKKDIKGSSTNSFRG